MNKKYFGTDGIRGEVGNPPITPDFMLKLGWAFGNVLSKKISTNEKLEVIIGKDTRVSGYMFESALEAGLVSSGVDVRLLGPMPTPAVATITCMVKASAGIVISASHNAYSDNGVKFFGKDGEKISDHDELAIESKIEEKLVTVSSNSLGKASRMDTAAEMYMNFCKSTVKNNFNLHGVRLALDCANGATYHLAPRIFEEMGAKLISLGISPDGFNINRDVGSTSISALVQTVKENDIDLGIAFDGDGDRVLFVDNKGDVVDGDQLLYLLALHRQRCDGIEGVVGTEMSNLGLENAFRDKKINFCRAKVGDRHVKQTMRDRRWILGGESSGHIICGDVTTTGDGIVAALQVLSALDFLGLSLRDSVKEIQKHPQCLINVPSSKSSSIEDPSVLKEIEIVRKKLGDNGRVLLRPSGTEPVIRVMVEAENDKEARSACEQLAKKIQEACS